MSMAWWEYIDVPPRTETFPCEFFHPLCCYPQLASWCRWCCAEYCKASCTKSVKLLSFMKVHCFFSHSTVWSAVYLVLSYNQWRRSLGRVTDNSGSANGLDRGSWSYKGSNKTNNISPSSNHEWRRKHVRVTYVCMSKNYKLLQLKGSLCSSTIYWTGCAMPCYYSIKQYYEQNVLLVTMQI